MTEPIRWHKKDHRTNKFAKKFNREQLINQMNANANVSMRSVHQKKKEDD